MERKKLREIIKDVLEIARTKGYDEQDIDKIMFSLDFKYNQEVILL